MIMMIRRGNNTPSTCAARPVPRGKTLSTSRSHNQRSGSLESARTSAVARNEPAWRHASVGSVLSGAATHTAAQKACLVRVLPAPTALPRTPLHKARMHAGTLTRTSTDTGTGIGTRTGTHSLTGATREGMCVWYCRQQLQHAVYAACCTHTQPSSEGQAA